MSTISMSLELALRHHHEGRFELAAQIYRHVLQTEPRHADAHHLLGLAAFAQNQSAAAIEHFQNAIDCNPAPAEFHHHLGAAYWATEQRQKAIDSYREALRIAPNVALVHNDLGNALGDAGQWTEAEHCYHSAVLFDPRLAEAHNNLATVLERQGRLADALAAFQQALDLLPTSPEIWFNFGNCHKALEKTVEAASAYRRALEIKPDFALAHHALGTILHADKKYAEAMSSYHACLRWKPDCLEALNGLGLAWQMSDGLDEAKTCYRQVLEKNPQDATARFNLANILRIEGDYDAAMEHLRLIVTEWPDRAAPHFFLGTLLLADGRFQEGWKEFEFRAGCEFTFDHGFVQSRWDGAPLGAKTLLLYSEYGFGDVIQFVRYLPLVQAREPQARIVISVQAGLVPLLKQSGFANVVDIDTIAVRFDLQLPLMSLPRVFQTTLADIPTGIPYILPDPQRVAQWHDRLKAIEGFKIGIHWQGNIEFANDRHRSMALSHFAPLARVPGVRLISLQKGPGSQQVAEVSGEFSIVTYDEMDDEGGAFMDTAAVMRNLDLVITSDSAVTHLAGAMGVPVWVALGYAPEWRWLRDREDSPWYPAMRLFRQIRTGDWSEVFARMAVQLEQRVASK